MRGRRFEVLTKVVEEIEIRATVMVRLHWKAVAANLRLKHPTIPAPVLN
jgi:hypothetical protein